MKYRHPMTDAELKAIDDMAARIIAVAKSDKTRTAVQWFVYFILALGMAAFLSLNWFQVRG